MPSWVPACPSCPDGVLEGVAFLGAKPPPDLFRGLAQGGCSTCGGDAPLGPGLRWIPARRQA